MNTESGKVEKKNGSPRHAFRFVLVAGQAGGGAAKDLWHMTVKADQIAEFFQCGNPIAGDEGKGHCGLTAHFLAHGLTGEPDHFLIERAVNEA